MNSRPSLYQVYIIRAWCEESALSGQLIVRYVLEGTESSSHRGFVSSKALLEAIASELAQIESALDNGDQFES